jgi:hypothetical protein
VEVKDFKFPWTSQVMKISVIIVNYNVKEFLHQCILTLKESLKNFESEIIVIDNNSVDGSCELIRRNFKDIILIENKENRGFATACNQGLRLAKGDFLLLLNPDTMVQEDTISAMVDFFWKHPEVGAAGCKILNADGTLQLACRRSFPTPLVALPKMLGLNRLFPKSKFFGRYNLTYLNPDELTEVDAVSGSFLMFRRQVWEEVGGLDEIFFMYGEDLDYCYRIKKAGWKVYYVPYTKAIHYKGESAKLAGIDSFIAFYKSMDVFVKKHFRKSYLVALDLILRPSIFFRGIISLIGRFIRKNIAMIVDGMLLVIAILIAHNLQSQPLPPYSTLLLMVIFYLVIWLGIGYVIGLYDKRELSYSRAIVASISSFIISLLFYFIFKGFLYTPKLIIWSFIVVMIFLPGWRIFLLFLQRRRVISPKSIFSRALLSRRTILLGTGEEGKRVAKKLHSNLEHGFEILGFVDKEFVNERVAGFPFLGVTEDLQEIIRMHRASEIIFTTDKFTNDEILDTLDNIKRIRVNVKIVPKKLNYMLGKSTVENIEDIPLIEVNYNLSYIGNRLLKRFLDIISSFIVTAVFTPVVIPYAHLAGYKLIRKRVVGMEGKRFKAYFLERDNNKNFGKLHNFPLIWSVLRGDMSLVGSEIILADSGNRYLRCKPGVTGLFYVQENHNATEADKRNYEHYYMQNYSVFLDIEILLKSLLRI